MRLRQLLPVHRQHSLQRDLISAEKSQTRGCALRLQASAASVYGVQPDAAQASTHHVSRLLR